jgi:hypothetical protein
MLEQLVANGVEVRPFHSGFGLFTSKSVVGRVAYITGDKIFNRTNIEKHISLPSDCTDKQALTLWFLLLKHQKVSGWETYCSYLPKTADYPVCWDPQAIEFLLLEGTGLDIAIDAKKRALENEFKRFQDWWALAGSVTFEDYLWAEHMVSSRSMESPIDQSLFVCPFIDFCNHQIPPNAHWEPMDMGIALIIDTPLNANDQIFISYGEKPNSELLFLHGFCLNSNPIQLVQFMPPYFELQQNEGRQDVDSPVCSPDAFGSIQDKRKLVSELGFDTIIQIHRPIGEKQRILDDRSLCTLFLCMLTAEQGLSKRGGNYYLADILINSGNFLELCKQNKMHDVLLLQIWTILLDMVVQRMETLSQELEDDLKGINKNVEMVEFFRTEQCQIIADIIPVLESLQSPLLASPVVQEFLAKNKE